MAPTAHVRSLVDRNAAVSDYVAPPAYAQLRELYAANPTIPRTVIISCADPRCHPEAVFNLPSLDPSLATAVIRNAGGDVQSALPAMLAIDNLVDFNNVILLKHTDCGSTLFRDDKIKAQLKDRAGSSAKEIEGMRFGENTVPVKESVKRDVAWLKENLLASEAMKNVTGMLLHLDSGRVEIIT